MKKKFTIYSLQFTIILAITLFLLINYHQTPTTFAAATTCLPQPTNPRVIDGLISATGISNNFSNPLGQCALDPDLIRFAPYDIEDYDGLKKLYYNQSKNTLKLTMKEGENEITSITPGYIYYYSSSNNISIGTYSLNDEGAAVIFIDKSLSITGDIKGKNDNGLVFVVKGNVYIDKDVKQIDAVIIAAGKGKIYTAADTSSDPLTSCGINSQSGEALTINGSLISLGPDAGSIVFCRSLSDNKNPAEIIIHQPKYLVLLKDLFSETQQSWSEVP